MLLAHETQEEAISIHAPRTGSDKTFTRWGCFWRTFQSTLPARGATPVLSAGRSLAANFNPRSPHGERPVGLPCPLAYRYFNPRSPHGERQKVRNGLPAAKPFQSTLPARGATRDAAKSGNHPGDFNPRSPHGERRCRPWHPAPRYTFQSTLPARGATACLPSRRGCTQYFNPRSPHGERQGNTSSESGVIPFQSTLPARGATVCAGAHARGGDFNPRSPHGERPRRWKLFFLHLLISIHAPRTGSDVKADDFAALIVRISIHAPRTGSDLAYADRMRWRTISIHAPRTGSDRHTKNTQPSREIFQSTLPARGATRSDTFRSAFTI